MEAIKIFKALSDETRLRIIHLLKDVEWNVNEIVDFFSMGQSRISRHLKILTDSGLLNSRRSGLWVFYTASEGAKEFLDLVSHQTSSDATIENDRKRLKDFLEEKTSQNKRFFDKIVHDWGKIKHSMLGGFDIAAVIESAVPESRIVADLGCGDGGLFPALAKKAENIIGVDHSAQMLSVAGEKAAGKANVDLRLGELEHLPLREAEVDAAVFNMTLHHLESPSAGIKEAYRVITPGGILLIADLLAHQEEKFRKDLGDRWLGFELADIEKWLKEAGFETRKITKHPLNNGLELIFCEAERI